jgi:hypothetical protein
MWVGGGRMIWNCDESEELTEEENEGLEGKLMVKPCEEEADEAEDDDEDWLGQLETGQVLWHVASTHESVQV